MVLTLNWDLVGLHLYLIAMLFSSYKDKEQVQMCDILYLFLLSVEGLWISTRYNTNTI